MVVTNYFKKWWLIQILVLCPCQPKCRTGSDRGSNSIKKVTTIENIDHKQYNRLYLWWLSLKKLMFILNTIAAIINSNCERRYLQPCQTYKKECFSIKVNDFSSYFRKSLHLRCLAGLWICLWLLLKLKNETNQVTQEIRNTSIMDNGWIFVSPQFFF